MSNYLDIQVEHEGAEEEEDRSQRYNKDSALFTQLLTVNFSLLIVSKLTWPDPSPEPSPELSPLFITWTFDMPPYCPYTDQGTKLP